MITEFELHGGDDSPSLPAVATETAKTIAEAAQKTRPWFMAISLGSRPRCFGCGGRMLPKVVVVQADHAICELCSSIDWSDLRPSWRAIESLGSPLELTRSRGITFWTPPASLPDQDAYIRWMELWDIMKSTPPPSPISPAIADDDHPAAPSVYDDPSPSRSGDDGC